MLATHLVKSYLKKDAILIAEDVSGMPALCRLVGRFDNATGRLYVGVHFQ